MQELKPCPFCGGEPELVDNRVEWFVRCGHCKPYATVIYGENARYIDDCDSDDEAKELERSTDWNALKQTAVDAWNRRA